jgi:two-component system sensor histidine kinase YesM
MTSRMRNPLTRMNVKQQLILLLLILVSPVFLLNWYANSKAEQILKNHVTNAYEELNKQNHFLINRDIDTINRIMSTIIQNPVTQRMILNEDEAEIDRVFKYAEMDKLLGNNYVGVNGGEAIYYSLFVHDPEENYGFAPSIPDINQSGVFFYSDRSKAAWIDQVLKEKGKGILMIMDELGPRGDQKTLAYARAVNSTSSGDRVVGVLVATKMDKKIEESFSTVSLPENGEIYLTDWSNRVLAGAPTTMGTLVELPPSTSEQANFEETYSTITDEYIYVVHAKYNLQQKLIYKIPVKSLLQQQNELKRVIQLISIVYSLFALVVMMYFWRSLMNPLQKLAMFARSHDPGKALSPVPSWERNDEVGVLIYSVYNMANRINDMIHDRYDMEIKQKEAQLQLLYQQINPHLLYNTLESIYWKSSLEGHTGSTEMIKELSKLMRISLSRGRELITIADELEHASAYASLQQKRYEYGFQMVWNISDEVLQNLIPKITLQPLIENAIIHGVMNMGEDGEIIVSASLSDDNIILTVEDNGYKETNYIALNQLVNEEQSQASAGYGIRNVHQRIQLHFGDLYGLRYEAREGEGTRVVVTLPQRTNTEPLEVG